MVENEPWWVYVLLCERDWLYIGIAKDVEARFMMHQKGRGAVFTKINKPLQILAREIQPSRSAALKLEYALKQLKTDKKWVWVRQRQT